MLIWSSIFFTHYHSDSKLKTVTNQLWIYTLGLMSKRIVDIICVSNYIVVEVFFLTGEKNEKTFKRSGNVAIT